MVFQDYDNNLTSTKDNSTPSKAQKVMSILQEKGKPVMVGMNFGIV